MYLYNHVHILMYEIYNNIKIYIRVSTECAMDVVFTKIGAGDKYNRFLCKCIKKRERNFL